MTAVGSSLADLAQRAAALAGSGRRAVIGIVGAPGGGKTTFARALCVAVRGLPGFDGPGAVVHVPMDGFHLADVELRRLGRLHAKGALDTFDPAGYIALLRRVRDGGTGTVYAPAFDRELEQPIAGSIPVDPQARLVVTEGIHLLAPEPAWTPLRPLLDELWYLETDSDLRRERLVERHVVFGKTREAAIAWVDAVDEPNTARVLARRDTADLIVEAAVLGPPDLVGAVHPS